MWAIVPHGTVMSSLSIAVFNSVIISLIVTKSSLRDFLKIKKHKAYLGIIAQLGQPFLSRLRVRPTSHNVAAERIGSSLLNQNLELENSLR
jgi:hypothetical protein